MTDKLVFKLSEKLYGIDTARVYGVIETDDIYFLPGRSGFVKGVISHRGKTVTVLDGGVLSGCSCGPREGPGKIVVVQIEGQYLGIDISTAEVSFLWDKERGKADDEENNPGHGLERDVFTGEIVDVPCDTMLNLASKILAPGRRRVLIADDMSFYRTAVKEALISGGFHVVAEACNGHEAIELTKKFQPEIVILDVVMPVKNGIEAAVAIKALPNPPGVVICSSLNDEDIIREAKEAGAEAYITKPFTRTEVLKTILDLS